MACLKVRENIFENQPLCQVKPSDESKSFFKEFIFPSLFVSDISQRMRGMRYQELGRKISWKAWWHIWSVGKKEKVGIFSEVQCRVSAFQVHWTWMHLVAPDCKLTWLHRNMIAPEPDCTWLHLIAPNWTWWHLITPGTTWLHLIAPEPDCISLVPAQASPGWNAPA